MKYSDCYRTLGASEASSWRELQLAYRRRIRECHPDRREAIRGNDDRDDEEFKQVVKAWHLLAGFYRSNGKLPPQHLEAMEDPLPLRDIVRRAEEASRESRWKHWLRNLVEDFRVPRAHNVVFMAFVAGVSAVALGEQLERSARNEGPAQDRTGELAVGMQPKDVLNVQGVPNHTKGSVWFYGKSGVIFDRGCVVGWQNEPPFPLQTLSIVNAYVKSSRNPLAAEHCSARD